MNEINQESFIIFLFISTIIIAICIYINILKRVTILFLYFKTIPYNYNFAIFENSFHYPGVFVIADEFANCSF